MATSPPRSCPKPQLRTSRLRARQSGVLAGRACVTETFRQLDPDLPLIWYVGDGSVLVPGQTIMEVTGPLRPILTAERTALNFLGRLSGVATLTAQYVAAAHARNPAVEVLDTRKTTPGLRALEKAAVQAGGGVNHRSSLSEAVLVKDNHLAGVTITEAVGRAPGIVAGPPGADRVRHSGAGGRSSPGGVRRRPARQHGPGDGRPGHRRGACRVEWPDFDRSLGRGDAAVDR